MLRNVVTVIYGATGITPDRIMTFFIIIGSLVIFEVVYYLIKRIVIERIIKRNKG